MKERKRVRQRERDPISLSYPFSASAFFNILSESLNHIRVNSGQVHEPVSISAPPLPCSLPPPRPPSAGRRLPCAMSPRISMPACVSTYCTCSPSVSLHVAHIACLYLHAFASPHSSSQLPPFRKPKPPAARTHAPPPTHTHRSRGGGGPAERTPPGPRPADPCSHVARSHVTRSHVAHTDAGSRDRGT